MGGSFPSHDQTRDRGGAVVMHDERDALIEESPPATFSPDRAYRYSLIRRISFMGEGHCVFCMLNPSTADEEINDPTVRRCIGFATRWGMATLEVVNAYALRATDPRKLKLSPDPVGRPDNDCAILEAASRADLFVVAWGAHIDPERAREVLGLIRMGERPKVRPMVALGFTSSGQPKHPLYVPYEARVTREFPTPEGYQICPTCGGYPQPIDPEDGCLKSGIVPMENPRDIEGKP